MNLWYPSHMARARREFRQNLRLVDVVIEILDARIPLASRIPDLPGLLGAKKSLLALNKSDLADPDLTIQWVKHFRRLGSVAVAINAKTGAGVYELLIAAKDVSARTTGSKKRLRPFRAMAVGIPNAGKSSLLNRLAGRRSARVGERPGITRGRQWIRAHDDLELLDLPGMLWPQRESEGRFVLLCITGAVPDEVFDQPSVAAKLVETLAAEKPGALAERYGITMFSHPGEALEIIARQRGYLGAGGVPDLVKGALAVLSDFRAGRFGRITLESTGDISESGVRKR